MKIQFLLKGTGRNERLGIMLLSSILKQRGHAVNLLLTEDLTEEECISRIINFGPQILAYSIMTGEHSYHIRLNEIIRNRYRCFSVFGGPHPTFYPEMIEKGSIEAVCRGEGDIYFLQLIERMEKNRDFYDTPNFWFKKTGGQIVRNPMGLLVENLDQLPFPDRKLLYDADAVLRSRGLRLFMSTRGCPYECTYCFNHAYNNLLKGQGQVLRYRSVDNLLTEILGVKKTYFLERVWIDDDTFLLKPDGWMEEFSEKFPKKIGIPMVCNVRANLVTEKTVRLLKQMNCISVCMGIECGDNLVATNILKRNISNEQIIRARDILRNAKIKVWTQNLIGLPVENPLETDLQTLDFNIKLKPEFGWAGIFYPYPGTELCHSAASLGMFKADLEKNSVSNKTESALDFGDRKLKQKLANLHKLFGIIVQFPFLRPFIKFLISLPMSYIYTWMFFILYGYKMLRLTSKKEILRSMKYYPSFYFKYVAGIGRKRIFKDDA